MPQRRTIAPRLLAAGFLASAAVHFVRPATFEPIMPRVIARRAHRPLIYLSGVIEVVCGYGLLRRRPWAPVASILVLVSVFPANVQMALDAGTGRNPGVTDSRALAWGRLPLQALMIWAAGEARDRRQRGDAAGHPGAEPSSFSPQNAA